ncbi:MAG: TetR/AcrR family transcriptional regulator [Acidimicrobiia bacterium]
MAKNVRKPAPRYHSPLRARQAAQTREAIIGAAITLFAGRGWAATTLPMVASEAGTAVDTIYSTFGSKSELLMAAVDVAIVGDDEAAPMVDRPDFALLGKGRQHERLRAGVHFTLGVYERSVPILKALQEAAASDAAARARLRQYDDDRRNVTAAGLTLILGDTPPDEIVDAMWALVSPEVFIYLTEGRRWPLPRAETWFVEMSRTAIGKPTCA